MEESKSNKGFKVAVVVLAVLLIASAVFGIKLYSDQKAISEQLEEDKQELIVELDNMSTSYAEAQAENEVINQDLEDAKLRIDSYIDSLKTAKADVAYLRRFRKQVQVLKDERERLLAENEELRASNRLLILERDSTAIVLAEQSRYSDSLTVQNLELAKVVEDGSMLVTTGLTAEGIKVLNSGKVVSTERARRADKVRVCFSLTANRIAQPGEREFYIQVLDPNNMVLGANAVLTKGDESLNYSKKTKFYYENSELDVCDYIDPTGGDKMVKGRYMVNVYERFRLVSETEFTLK